ncbi:MAG: glycosyltransferase family 1 protein [Sphingobacteriales bacterium]|nr:MAG: glycosyltransferase family 1 protein [Sphingobacteriales bacterium]
MFNVVEQLDKSVFEPWIGIQKPGGSLYEEIEMKGYPILVAPFLVSESSGIKEKLVKARQYAKAFIPYNFQVWQSFNWSSDFTEALVARWAGARYVYVKKNMNWNRLAWKLKSLLSYAIVARNSDLVRNYFSTWYFKGKAYLITGGVAAERFAPQARNNVRQQFGIPEDAYLVCCVAQLVRIKDQLTLIRAVAEVPHAYLVLAGATRDEAYLKEVNDLIAELKMHNQVRVPGPVADVNALLNASDIFVLPTGTLLGHEEGCPVALLEAMAAGVPCIASNVAGSRDLINDDTTGLLFDPGNHQQLVHQIKRYKADPVFARQMAVRAREQVKAKHTLQKEGEAFANMYLNIVGRR